MGASRKNFLDRKTLIAFRIENKTINDLLDYFELDNQNNNVIYDDIVLKELTKKIVYLLETLKK